MTRKLMMMAAAVAAAVGAWAAKETVDGYTWTYCINGDTAEIFNYYSAAISPKTNGCRDDSLHTRRQARDEHRVSGVLQLQRTYGRDDT